MSKLTKIFSVLAMLSLYVIPVSAQDLEVGTGAVADDSAPGFNIVQNPDGTYSADRDDVSVEFVPTEGAEETEDISTALDNDTDTESMFSLRRITKWGGVIIAVLLIITVLMQEKGVGLSSTFGGSGGFYASKRGAEKILFYFTVVLAVVFAVLNVLAMSL